MSANKLRVCIVGCGPSGMSALYQLGKIPEGERPDIVCYEKQAVWCGQWNVTWRTGMDEYGEPLHNSQYYHLWTNAPKECLEYPYYTFEQHFGKAMPSHPPGPVIRDYLEGRMQSSKEDLKRYVKFSTIVRRIEYDDEIDVFTVVAKNQEKDEEETKERFTHVIIATGIFSVPYSLPVPGIDTFQGRVLHSHDFRAAKQFHNQRLLIIGVGYSGEDLATQSVKYGAKSVIICGRKSRGLKWPPGIEERPLVERFDGNTAYFQDDSSAEFDVVIYCTGYRAHYPFLADNLRLKIPENSFYPNDLYKGILWTRGGNNKLLYLATQNQLYSMTMFDIQALWAVRYILGMIQIPKTTGEMLHDIEEWQKKFASLTRRHEVIDFQRDYVADLVNTVPYMSISDVGKIADRFHDWEDHRCEDYSTFRDHQFTSIFTGSLAPLHHTAYMKAYDDSKETFINQTVNNESNY